MAGNKIKVALYEDNPGLRLSLSKYIKIFPEFELTGAYPNAIRILDDIKESKPEVILMDIDMPGITGIEAAALVHHNFPEIKVVMQTVFDDDDKVFRSICAGAVGYTLKKASPDQILDYIRLASEGGAPMTPSIASKVLNLFRQHSVAVPAAQSDLSAREKEVLSLLSAGLSYKMIAKQFEISIDTVRFHIKNIYDKLHVHSMTEAVAKAFREKLI